MTAVTGVPISFVDYISDDGKLEGDEIMEYAKGVCSTSNSRYSEPTNAFFFHAIAPFTLSLLTMNSLFPIGGSF